MTGVSLHRITLLMLWSATAGTALTMTTTEKRAIRKPIPPEIQVILGAFLLKKLSTPPYCTYIIMIYTYAMKTITAVIIIGFIVFLNNLPYVTHYDRQNTLMINFIENRGCAFEDCPKVYQDKIISDNGGVLPPQYFEKGSKEYWHSFCTYLKELCY